VLYLNKIKSPHNLKLDTSTGKTDPLYCTGFGKILLSGFNEEELKAYLATTRLVQYTDKTITEPDRLLKHIRNWIANMMRCIEAGFRGFLVYDEGILFIVNKMREEGFIPKETLFKFSVFGGYRSPAGAKIIESMGANTINPASDVSLPITVPS
jgi:hypothetical protein